MTVIRMPQRKIVPQKNLNREWPISHVSPQDGTVTSLDTVKREVSDIHGNTIPADTIAGNRPWQIFRRWLRANFGW